MNHLMIDLETISKRKNACLLQAGWAVFDPEKPGDVVFWREMNVNIDSCLALGGVVDDSTIRYWLTGSAEARASVARPGVAIEAVLTQLAADYREHKCSGIWSNGATFDIPMIEFYWDAAQRGEKPWKYWDARDTRTLWWLAEKTGWKKQKGETAHTAAQDSIVQVGQVQSAFAALRRTDKVSVDLTPKNNFGDPSNSY